MTAAHRLADDANPCAETLCLDNQRLVYAMARRMLGRGIDYDDLVGWGMMGLVKAARGFDAARGFAFSTYAVPLILGEMRRAVREGSAVHVVRSLQETAMHAIREQKRLEDELGREVSIDELAAAMGLSPAEVVFALDSRAPAKPLDAPDDTGRPLLERLPDHDASRMPGSTTYEVRALIDALPERNRMLMRLRYDKGMTQAETARVLGISQVQVSRLESRILGELREGMETN